MNHRRVPISLLAALRLPALLAPLSPAGTSLHLTRVPPRLRTMS